MKLVIDMNLSPIWVSVFERQGWQALHWISIGPVNPPDVKIMDWARENGFCVVTNDLDFSAILAATQARGPSVIQIRGQDVSPDTLGPTLISVIDQHQRELLKGAILTVDMRNSRVRSLPLHRDIP